MTQTLFVTRGLPGSGKSTYAKKLCLKSRGLRVRRVNRDDIRLMMGEYNDFTKTREDIVTQTQIAAVEAILGYGDSVIVDDCNLDPKYVNNWRSLAEAKGVPFEIIDFTGVPLRECLKRNQERTGDARTPNKVIHEMYRKWLSPDAPLKDETLPTAVIVDMDGTLAIIGNRSPYDATDCDKLDSLNKPVAKIVHKMAAAGHRIIIMSGRDDKHAGATIRFLKIHGIDYHRIYMRKTGDTRKDFVVKKELYEREIAGKYNVEFCLDDRDQVVDLWRSLGLTCFQVNEGWF